MVYQRHLERMRVAKLEENMNMEGGVKCMLCEMKSNSLLSHITRMHCSLEEYKEKFPNAPIYSETYLSGLSQRVLGAKNPAYQHGGKFSPYSDKFIHGKDPLIHQRAAESRIRNGNDNTQLEYYLKRGLSPEEAAEALSKRQKTFSLEKCVARFGEEKGTKIWQKRQDNWMATLDQKSPEEKRIINQKKMNPDICISRAEKELVSKLIARNYEVKTQQALNDANWIYDIVVGKKIIEYHGDYWHCNPNKYPHNYYHKKLQMFAEEKWELDAVKRQHAISKGYEYFVIWEHQYKQDPEKVINECICFLNK